MTSKSDLETWRQTRLASASSLRQLAHYVDNVTKFSSILLDFRAAVFSQGALIGRGLLTLAAGVSVPFIIAGSGISLASYISQALGGGGAAAGACLGAMGGALTLASGGAAAPVLVAGVTIYIGSFVVRILGGGMLGSVLNLAGKAVIIISLSSGLVIVLGGVGLYLAIPALNREITTSRFVSEAIRDIKTDFECSKHILGEIKQNRENSERQIDVLSNVILFAHKQEEFNTVSLSNLSDHILVIIQKQDNASLHLTVLANDLEESAEIALQSWLEIEHEHTLSKL